MRKFWMFIKSVCRWFCGIETTKRKPGPKPARKKAGLELAKRIYADYRLDCADGKEWRSSSYFIRKCKQYYLTPLDENNRPSDYWIGVWRTAKRWLYYQRVTSEEGVSYYKLNGLRQVNLQSERDARRAAV